MPVTAKLSRRFYDALGDEVANELVAWFNSVDATYRSDLRELNELNFARFDAKLEQRLAGLRADFDGRFAVFEVKVEQRFAQFEAKLEQRVTRLEAMLEQRLAEIEQRLTQFEQRFTQVDARFETLEARLLGRLEARIEGVRSEMQRWMLASWSSMMLVLIATLFAVLRTR